VDRNESLQEKRNSLRSKLLELIEDGVPERDEEDYDAQFKHLGITEGEQNFLSALVGHQGLEVLIKIFRLRIEAVENRLKYWEGGSATEKLEFLSLWQALSMALEDLRNFPKMATSRGLDPTQVEENDDDFLN
jgi:hypothetical protein